MLLCCCVVASKHMSNFLVYCFFGTIIDIFTTFFYQMVFYQTTDFYLSCVVRWRTKAPHNIFAGKLFGQSLESLDGFLPTLHIDIGIL